MFLLKQWKAIPRCRDFLYQGHLHSKSVKDTSIVLTANSHDLRNIRAHTFRNNVPFTSVETVVLRSRGSQVEMPTCSSNP